MFHGLSHFILCNMQNVLKNTFYDDRALAGDLALHERGEKIVNSLWKNISRGCQKTMHVLKMSWEMMNGQMLRVCILNVTLEEVQIIDLINWLSLYLKGHSCTVWKRLWVSCVNVWIKIPLYFWWQVWATNCGSSWGIGRFGCARAK